MTLEDIRRIVDLMSYKPGWTVRVRSEWVVDDADMETLRAQGVVAFEQLADVARQRPYLQAHYDGSGEYGSEPWTGRKWMLSTHMTKSEIVYTAFKAIMAAEEHETREFFKYRGHEVCGPHFDVDDIVEQIEQRRLHHDVRSDAMQGAP